MTDWYLDPPARVLQGSSARRSREDIYGDQMNMMANLVRPKPINDVVAYINTLR